MGTSTSGGTIVLLTGSELDIGGTNSVAIQFTGAALIDFDSTVAATTALRLNSTISGFNTAGAAIDVSNIADDVGDTYTCTSGELDLFDQSGNAIDTPLGENAVEDLEAGDVISLADGSTAMVKWMGHRRGRDLDVVRVRTGALGASIPRRDYLVPAGNRAQSGNGDFGYDPVDATQDPCVEMMLGGPEPDAVRASPRHSMMTADCPASGRS